MTRLFSTAALLAALPLAAAAQAAPVVPADSFNPAHALQIASLDKPSPISSSSEALPDAPQPEVTPSENFAAATAGLAMEMPATAPKYATIILPGQTAVPLHGMQKAVYGVRDAFSPLQLLSITASAGWSHLIDSAPHYGTNSEAFGKREGVAALRSTIQIVSTDAVFSPIFHDDPRYFAMGAGKPFTKRVIYAASRVVLVRSSYSNKTRFNAPLLLGYGVAAAANNAYYPDRDRGGKETFYNWAGSLGGAALGFEVSEFLDDALRMVHIRK